MALTKQHEHTIRALTQIGEALTGIPEAGGSPGLLDRMWFVLTQWNSNDMFNALNDEDIAEIFPGLNKGKVIEGINAFKAIVGAMGQVVNNEPVRDYSTGKENNLVKLRG